MKYLLSLILMALGTSSIAADPECRSQLVRMELDRATLQNKLAESNTEAVILRNADAYFKSEAFRTMFLADYPIVSFGFPYNIDNCKKDKESGNPRYRNFNCENYLMCSSASVPEVIKSELCFSLPCAFMKGRNMSECRENANARPTFIHFPEPVTLKKISMQPTSVQLKDKTLRGCFRITEMDVAVAVSIDFDNTMGVKYDTLGLKNLRVQLDGPRDVCMSAQIDLGAEKPITAIALDNKTVPFVTDRMITQSLSAAVPHGLTGYTEETISTLKITVLPTMARYFRSSIEDAIKASLASTFELSVNSLIQKTGKSEGTMNVAADGAISEIGVSNLAVTKHADLIDCALQKKRTGQVLTTSPCLNQIYSFSKNPLKAQDVPTVKKATVLFAQEFDRYDHVASESLRVRLLGMKADFKDAEQFAERISRAQNESPALDDIHFLTKIWQEQQKINVGLAFSRLCNQNKNSSHDGRSIPGCPISTYIDLDEMNSLLNTLYVSGRLCHKGSGDFRAELDRKGQPAYNRDGSPRGSGCLFIIEDIKDGMSCYLHGAPKISREPSGGKYNLSLKTKACYRGAVLLGQGKVGGDINFDVSFDPGFCGTDFCLENGVANWNVVPGTARFALREPSFFNGIVRSTVDKKINEVLKGTIRIPLATEQGPLSKFPIMPDGRTDKGQGYFGACLKFK